MEMKSFIWRLNVISVFGRVFQKFVSNRQTKGRKDNVAFSTNVTCFDFENSKIN